jgi:hypothetical protein
VAGDRDDPPGLSEDWGVLMKEMAKELCAYRDGGDYIVLPDPLRSEMERTLSLHDGLTADVATIAGGTCPRSPV